MTDSHPAVNHGVVITGQARVSGPVAAGRDARAVQQGAGPADPLSRIEALLAELQQGLAGPEAARDLPPDRVEDAVQDVARVRDEARRGRPDAEVIRRILARLAGTVGSAATLLAKVEQVKELVTLLVR